MSELFDIPQSLSPRLSWMDEHGIWTRKIGLNAEDSSEMWQAEASGFTARGPDEDSAIVALAQMMGIKLWNEV
jgi:hypothetical protein